MKLCIALCFAFFAFNPEIERARDIASATSVWDEEELHHDYIILGAGIVGLSTAIEIKQQESEARVLVLERGSLPSGASSRNAGFACIGSFTELLHDIEVIGQENAIQQIIDRWEGLNTLRKKVGDEAIAFELCGNYELIDEASVNRLSRLEEVNRLLEPYFGEKVFVRCDEKIQEFGFSQDYIKAAVFNKFEGMLDSGKLMQALRDKAQKLGIVIRYGSQAARPVQTDKGLEVSVGDIVFKAPVVGVCINAFTSELIPEIKVKPGRAQVLVTEPLKEVLFNAPVHLAEGFWFFRPLPGNRILLGGGRHLDFEGETTTVMEITPQIIGPLKALLTNLITPDSQPKIERCWSGIMGFSEDHLPHVEEVPGLENVVVGFGCNGMGIARGYPIGERTAALLIKKRNAK